MDNQIDLSTCISMYTMSQDVSKIHKPCRPLIEAVINSHKAWQGAAPKDRIQHMVAAADGLPNHHMVQRDRTQTSQR